MNSKEIVLLLLEKRRPDLSIAGLEREIGISNGTIGKWDNAIPSTKIAQKVANYFHVPLSYIFGQESNTNNLTCLDHQPVDLKKVIEDETWDKWLSFDGMPLSDTDKEIIRRLFNN